MTARAHPFALAALVVVAGLTAGVPLVLEAQAAGALAVDKCAAYAGVIALAVSLLKRIPFIGKNPKTVATVLSALVVLFPVLLGKSGLSIAELVGCVLAQLTMGVGIYEVAKQPLRAVGVDPGPADR